MVESVQKFRGKILNISVERVLLPNGHRADLEIARHPGGAAVVAVDDRLHLCLLHQYRYAAGGWLWELPAGKIDQAEPPIETARRELAEEAGIVAARWTSLGGIFTSPGVLTEVIHLYLARNLHEVPAALEAHEVLKVAWIAYPRVLDMIRNGEIKDAKSIAGICMAQAHIEL